MPLEFPVSPPFLYVSSGHACTGGGRNAAWGAFGLQSDLGGKASRVCCRDPDPFGCGMETQGYPISVRVIGVMHKEKSKVRAQTLSERLETFFVHLIRHLYLEQMYMTSVLWSDHNEILVYRTFQDFKKMHVSGARVADVDALVGPSVQSRSSFTETDEEGFPSRE